MKNLFLILTLGFFGALNAFADPTDCGNLRGKYAFLDANGNVDHDQSLKIKFDRSTLKLTLEYGLPGSENYRIETFLADETKHEGARDTSAEFYTVTCDSSSISLLLEVNKDGTKNEIEIEYSLVAEVLEESLVMDKQISATTQYQRQ